MFQRFASALFGDDVDELSRRGQPGIGAKEDEEDEDWILVNYLAEACSSQCGEALSGSSVGRDDDEDDDEEGLVMIPSPVTSSPIRYPSCTSLNSTADTDAEGCAEEDEEDEEGGGDEESGFLRLDACSLEESWFVTPPPCFTGRSSSHPVLLETSPLENLLIEHPSMSVYAHHSPPRLALDALPRSLNQDLDFLSTGSPKVAPARKEKPRRSLEASRHRPEVTIVQRRSSLQAACYAAAFSASACLLQQQQPCSATIAQRTQPLSRKALRRLNLLRPPKATTMHLHQPSQRHLNF